MSQVERRILIFGNSGSGKTTLARRLSEELGVPRLDLDLLAWEGAGVRRALEASTSDLHRFAESHSDWVIEGCYGDLIEAVVPRCTEIIFLNPGTEVCIENCRTRPWEPEKYPNPAEQDAGLDFLLDWVRRYETRSDEFSLERHRTIFERFEGPKEQILGRSAI